MQGVLPGRRNIAAEARRRENRSVGSRLVLSVAQFVCSLGSQETWGDGYLHAGGLLGKRD